MRTTTGELKGLLVLLIIGAAALGFSMDDRPPTKPPLKVGARNILSGDQTACRDAETSEQLTRIAVSHDQPAFDRLFYRSLSSGACWLLKAGTVVYVDQLGFGRICLREAGATECGWTQPGALD